MAKRKPARSRGTRRGAASRATTKQRRSERPSALAALRQRIRSGFGRHADDFWGIALIVLGLLVTLSFFSLAGPLGGWIQTGMRVMFGVWGYVVGGSLIVLGVALVLARPRNDYARIAAGFIITFVGSLALFHLMTGTVSLSESVDLVKERGGAVGSLVAYPLRRIIGFWGAFVVLTAITALGVLVVTRTTLRDIVTTVGMALRSLRTWVGNRRDRRPARPTVVARPARPEPPGAAAPTREEPAAEPHAAEPAARAPRKAAKPPVVPVKGSGYRLPPLDLLALGGGSEHNRRSLDDTARELEETLVQHGVDARLTRIVPGPTVTRYEIELAPGV
jgi:S-DNA-T family DNA segregation ATPase FtsK/SpoIIIE